MSSSGSSLGCAARERDAFVSILVEHFEARIADSHAKDWVDVDGILIHQTGRLDWDYVRRQLTPLVELKEAPEILATLDSKRREFAP